MHIHIPNAQSPRKTRLSTIARNLHFTIPPTFKIKTGTHTHKTSPDDEKRTNEKKRARTKSAPRTKPPFENQLFNLYRGDSTFLMKYPAPT